MKPSISNVVQTVAAFFTPRAKVNQRHEPANLSADVTVQKIQGYLRAAENGDTRQLFTLYRDLTAGGSHVQAEFAKRKLALLGDPRSVMPRDKKSAEDIKAAQACEQMITDCENWMDALIQLQDSVLWPVSVVEKIFRPAEETMPGKIPLRYTLHRLEPVNPTLFCFQWRYKSIGARSSSSASLNATRAEPELRAPLVWEPDLRFYNTDADGNINYSTETAYAAEPARHIVHRCHLLTGLRDNFGGPMRAIVFWDLLSKLGRDWFGRSMERYGTPFPVGRTDTNNPAAVALLQEAFALSTKIGGLVVDHDTQIELKEIAISNVADAFEKFINVCHREISKLIVGQTMSSDAQASGLGSGNAQLHGEVRDDYRTFDQIKLGETIERQLFEPFLRINGLRGAVPRIIWGGVSPEEVTYLADQLVKLSQAGLEPSDEAVEGLQDRFGFGIQRKAPVPMANPLAAFSANLPSPISHPSDRIAAAKAKALGDAYRGNYAPVRAIILNSTSPEDCQKKLAAFYADWSPAKVNQITEEALQLCAAAGAAAAKA